MASNLSRPIGVIGAGAWGTALSLLLARKGYPVDLWVYEKELCRLIKETKENKFFLPDCPLPVNIRPTNSIEEAVAGKSAILLAVPTHVARQTLVDLKERLQPDCLIINASKGIENESLFTVHQMMQDILDKPYIPAALSGPTFAAEVAKGSPSVAVAASTDEEKAETVKNIFSTPTFKIFTSDDIMGVELGGALKNVIAIATGISDAFPFRRVAFSCLTTAAITDLTSTGRISPVAA